MPSDKPLATKNDLLVITFTLDSPELCLFHSPQHTDKFYTKTSYEVSMVQLIIAFAGESCGFYIPGSNHTTTFIFLHR